MSYNTDTLKKLLVFIDEIANQPENIWFKDSLSKRFVTSPLTTSSDNTIEPKIDLIQKYLALDISDLKKVHDYAGFEEPTREQLFRDCLEMVRHEKGVASHKIDFGEFCRYAHLQAEEMLNYLLNKKSNRNIELIHTFIKANNEKYNPKEKPKEIHHIGYSIKLFTFKRILSLRHESFNTFLFLNEFRNELSHRNSLTSISEEKDMDLYEKAGYNSGFDHKNSNQEEKKIYNRGKFIITKRNEDFPRIYEAIDDLKHHVLRILSEKKEMFNLPTTIGDSSPELQKLKEKMN